MPVVGVDACRSGWIAVVVDGGTVTRAAFLRTVEDLPAGVPGAEVVAIDIPIGLPAAGRRRADVEARARLGRRRSSLFFTPVRAALEAESFLAAGESSVRLTGSGISRQAYGLRAKILEVEAWLPRAGCDVREVHPELSFAAMLGAPAAAPKKTWAGMVERRAALARHGLLLDGVTGAAATHAAVDDVLDAAAAAWSAARIAAGRAFALPEEPEVDDRGRPVAIWV